MIHIIRCRLNLNVSYRACTVLNTKTGSILLEPVLFIYCVSLVQWCCPVFIDIDCGDITGTITPAVSDVGHDTGYFLIR
jgi:hypothetical protein